MLSRRAKAFAVIKSMLFKIISSVVFECFTIPEFEMAGADYLLHERVPFCREIKYECLYYVIMVRLFSQK